MYIPVCSGRGLGRDGGFDGVDVAPAGCARRTRGTREFPADPAGITTRAPSLAVRQSMDDEAEVRTGSRNRRESVGASCASQPDDTTGILASFASTQPFAYFSTLKTA